MSETTTVKGEIPARIAGVLIIIYGLIIFVTTLFVAKSMAIGIVLLLVCGILAVLIGIGLNSRNYYAWFAALALTLVSLLGGLILLLLSYVKGVSAESSDLAVKLLWPVIFFCLLLAAKPACSRTDSSLRKLCAPVKRHFAVLLAVSLTLVTLLALKAAGLGALLVIGFPALVIEGGLLYVLGLNIQKRLGWGS